MAEIGRWNGRTFVVSPNLIRSFKGLTVRGSSETEEKISDKQKYVTRKNANPAEVSLAVLLNALVGSDVRGEAMILVEDARSGAADYFYVGGKKLLPCKLMLTEASVSETEIAASGVWVSCEVRLTMKQAGKYDTSASASTSSSSTGSKKTSVKTNSAKTTTKTTTTVTAAASAALTANAALKVSSALNEVKRIISNAKKASSGSTGNAAAKLVQNTNMVRK